MVRSTTFIFGYGDESCWHRRTVFDKILIIVALVITLGTVVGIIIFLCQRGDKKVLPPITHPPTEKEQKIWDIAKSGNKWFWNQIPFFG